MRTSPVWSSRAGRGSLKFLNPLKKYPSTTRAFATQKPTKRLKPSEFYTFNVVAKCDFHVVEGVVKPRPRG